MVAPKTWDPMHFHRMHWPHEYLYSHQRELMYSIFDNDETLCGAGNMLGKDFTLARAIVAFVMTRHPVRVVTTSAKDAHLKVLWGEINNAIATSVLPLDAAKGGPLVCTDKNIRKIRQSGPLNGEVCGLSYCIGMVASHETIAAMQGHHIAKTGDGIPRTLFAVDECSSVWDEYWTKARTWANRMVGIGNMWPCNNFFKRAFEGDLGRGDPGGDIPRPRGRSGYHRKVLRIEATDSPNVRYALAEIEAGKEPSGKILVKGVKDWEEYQKNLATMTEDEQEVVLRARFYKGKGVMMYPADWIKYGVQKFKELRSRNRVPTVMGIDPGEGGADTVHTIGDEHGIIKQFAKKTPDTSEIRIDTMTYMDRFGIAAERVAFDRGGGGHQIADEMRRDGYDVMTVGFGDRVVRNVHDGVLSYEEKVSEREAQFQYLNKRAQMYHMLRLAMDPANGGFAIPPECAELMRQLEAIPYLKDSEGRVRMLPKGKRTPDSKELTLVDLLGCSPDEVDSTVLMVYARSLAPKWVVAGAI